MNTLADCEIRRMGMAFQIESVSNGLSKIDNFFSYVCRQCACGPTSLLIHSSTENAVNREHCGRGSLLLEVIFTSKRRQAAKHLANAALVVRCNAWK